MTSQEVINALWEYHEPAVSGQRPQWTFFNEQRIGTGWGHEAAQSMDAWAIHLWPSKKNLCVAYEVKVTRSDFLREIKDPLKRRPALRLSNEFYFVTPKGLLKPEEIPPECGLMEVENGKVYFEIKAPTRDMCPPTWNFVAALTRYSRTRIQEVASAPPDEVLQTMYRTLFTVVENFLEFKGPKWKLTHMVNTIKQHRANPKKKEKT